jgi:hypothetical protein
MQARGNTPAHVELTAGRVAGVLDGCPSRQWLGLAGNGVLRSLSGLRASRAADGGLEQRGAGQGRGLLGVPTRLLGASRDVLRNFLSIGMLRGNVDSLPNTRHDSVMLRASRIRQHGPVIGTATLAAEVVNDKGPSGLRRGRPAGGRSGGVS